MAERITFRQLQIELVELAERGGDPSPLLPSLDDDFRRAQDAQFASGRGWKPVSAAYSAQKAREGRGNRVGVYSGGLAESLSETGGYHVARFTRDKSFVVGSSNPVANLFGGKHRSRRQPKRKPVRFTPAMRREWLAWVQDYLAEGRLP